MLIRKNPFIAFIFAFIISGCSSSPEVLVKTDSRGETISAGVDKEFIINLEGQLSTGCAWKVSNIPASFKIIKENVKTEENDKAGGIDIQQFIYKSAEKGDFTLVFNYARHWEKKPKIIKTTTITIKIE